MTNSKIQIQELDWNTVVIQPTALCNLNCKYCYLPDRQEKRFVKTEVIDSVARSVSQRDKQTMILWHGGEPLMTGVERFSSYISIFKNHCRSEYIRHSLQTNATLINDKWCNFFETNNFRVGVSIDGNQKHNESRRNWANNDTFGTALRGIETLRKNNIKFGIIAVVNKYNIDEPEEMYSFLSSLGPRSISINFEESEGANVKKTPIHRELINKFWERLLLAWERNPVTPIRHFRDVLVVMNQIVDNTFKYRSAIKNVYPTIDTEGDVVLLSPEFISVPIDVRSQFVVGNVIQQDLNQIIQQGSNSWYVQDFLKSIEMCAEVCDCFPFCQGGQASNKYFELSTIKGTETTYCFAARISPAKAIINRLSINTHN